jgi:O-antigen/teichoic acid export membrane protein
MTTTPRKDSPGVEQNIWGKEPHELSLVARTLSVDYLATFVELAIGIFMLPFNVAYLGQAAYGLWMLVAAPTVWFSMLDLGYGASLAKFVTQYRARRDVQALNEVTSTMFVVYTLIGAVAYGLGALVAFNLTRIFEIGSTQAGVGRDVILLASVSVAIGFPVNVFGGIVSGFQRRYLNGAVAIGTSLVVAGVNVIVLLLGHGLVAVVACTTVVRLLSFIGYRMTAYRVFPALRIRLAYVRFSRLLEITRFSAFMLLLDLSHKLNYWSDTLVIGAVLNTTAVAVWAVAQRLAEMALRLTNRLSEVLFPVIVDSATMGNIDRLRRVLLQGTRISLAMVLPVAAGLALLAKPLVLLWVGGQFAQSIIIVQLLAAVVVCRVGSSTARRLLQGAGDHKLLAFTNISVAVTNILLSIVLAQRMELVGVALGTLIPLALASVLLVMPAACRRADISIREFFTRAVWPALWPALAMAVVLLGTRDGFGSGSAGLLLNTLLGGTIYLTLLFGVALDRTERAWYVAKLRELGSAARQLVLRAA